MVTIICAQCGTPAQKRQADINRAAKEGRKLFCGRACSSLSRRRAIPLTEAERKAEKRRYDRERRIRLSEELRAKKRVSYYANHEVHLARQAELRADPEAKAKHAEYIKSERYRQWKAEYDRQFREAEYGEFAETWRLLLDLEAEIRSQATSYERRVANGYYTRNAQKRRRELWQLKQRT